MGSIFLLHDCLRYVAFLVILAESSSILFPVKNAFNDGAVIFKHLKYTKMSSCENASANK